MKIIYTKQALLSLQAILDFINENHKTERVIEIRDQILNTIDRLQIHPRIGQYEPLLAELKLGRRRLVVNHYKINYRIEEEKIFITDVVDKRIKVYWYRIIAIVEDCDEVISDPIKVNLEGCDLGEFEITNNPGCGDETEVTQAEEVDLAKVLKPGDQFVMNDLLFTIQTVSGVGSFSGTAVAESQLSFANIGGPGSNSLLVKFSNLSIDKNCRVRSGSIVEGSGEVNIDEFTLEPYKVQEWNGEIALACETVDQDLDEYSSDTEQITDDANLQGNEGHEEGGPAGDRVDPNAKDSITDPNDRDTTTMGPVDSTTTEPVEGTCDMELTLFGDDMTLCPGDEPLSFSITIANPNADSSIVVWSGPDITVDKDERTLVQVAAPGTYTVIVTLHGKPKCQVSSSFTVEDGGEDCIKAKDPLALFYDGETFEGCSAEEIATRRAAAKDLAAKSESLSRSASADPAVSKSSLSRSAEDACDINVEVECKNNYLFEVKNLEEGETVDWSYDLGEEGNFEITTAADHIIIKRQKGKFKSGAWIKATSADRPDEVLQINISFAEGQACQDVCDEEPIISVAQSSLNFGMEVTAKRGDSKHFITYKGSTGTIDLEVESSLSDEEFEKCFEWDLSRADGVSFAKEVYIAVGEPGFHLVRLTNRKTGQQMAEYYVWVIWTEKERSHIAHTNPSKLEDGWYTGKQEVVVFEFKILPEVIVNTAYDVPNLTGLFDISRDIQVEYTDSDNSFDPKMYMSWTDNTKASVDATSWPKSSYIIRSFAPGNDDGTNGDEDNEVYTAGSRESKIDGYTFTSNANSVSSYDGPNSPGIYTLAPGMEGQIVTVTNNFREYVNLKIGSTKTISNQYPWSSIRSYKYYGGKWEDNNSRLIH